MSREIKFRIWDKELEEMNYIDLCDLAEGDDYWYDGETSVWEVMNDATSEQKRYVIQQYTSLKDKTGKEIYEGDIIKYSYFSYQGKSEDMYIVQFSRHMSMGWWLHNTKEDSNHGSKQMSWNSSKNYEVIGNIYESEKENVSSTN